MASVSIIIRDILNFMLTLLFVLCLLTHTTGQDANITTSLPADGTTQDAIQQGSSIPTEIPTTQPTTRPTIQPTTQPMTQSVTTHSTSNQTPQQSSTNATTTEAPSSTGLNNVTETVNMSTSRSMAMKTEYMMVEVTEFQTEIATEIEAPKDTTPQVITDTTTAPSQLSTLRSATTVRPVTGRYLTEVYDYEDEDSVTHTTEIHTTPGKKKKSIRNVIFPIVIFAVIFLLLLLVIGLTYLFITVARTKMGLATTYNLSAASNQANGHKNPAFDDGEIAGDMTQNGGLRHIRLDMNKSETNDEALTPL